MSADKRTVATDALETLGTIIDDKQKRDAIHLAVEPVVAGETMHPGQSIEIRDGVAFATARGKGLGIIDPFLPDLVYKGQRFWFVMYPRQVTSLRHVWTHPAFPDEPGVHEPPKPDKAASEAWLRQFCASADCPSYETVMQLISTGTLPVEPGYERYHANGGYYDEECLHFGGRDAHGDIPLEFWDHVETVLGRPVPYRSESFSCSC